MRKRLGYLLAFFAVFGIEICIALFVRDNFVRPYVGDILVTVLLCCLAKAAFPEFRPAGPVFLFAAAVEGAQWLGLTEKLGLQGTAIGIILGSTFDWKDLFCYSLGCALFAAAEQVRRKRKQHLTAK